MVREVLADVAVVAATLATLSMLLPQIAKLLRTGDPTGVSTTWPAIGLVNNVGWVVYLAHEALWPSLLAPIGAAAGHAVTLWALGRSGRPLAPSAVRGTAYAVATAAIALATGWHGLGVALGLSFGLMIAPALWVAYRTPVPAGISPGTWWLSVAEAGLWGFFGWHHADAGIVTYAVVALAGSAAMLGRYAAAGRRPLPAV